MILNDKRLAPGLLLSLHVLVNGFGGQIREKSDASRGRGKFDIKSGHYHIFPNLTGGFICPCLKQANRN